MAKFWRKKAILAKVEAVEGVDAAPTGAADAILATNVTLKPMEGGTVGRALDRPHLGAQGEILINTHAGLDFEVEMAGAGAAGQAPAWAPLLAACGFEEHLDPGVEANYTPVSDAAASVSIHINVDGVRHVLRGARGSVKAVVAPGAIPKLAFTFLGLFSQPTDEALPAVDTSGFQTPLPVSRAATAFSLHGQALPTEAIEIDLGNQVEGRFLVNSEGIRIVDRAAKGSATVEAPALAVVDFFTIAKSRARGPLSLVQGTAPGNIVAIAAPLVEVGPPVYGQSQGIVTLQLPLSIVPSDGGDDELVVSVR